MKTSRDTAGPQPLCILVVDDQPDQSALTVAALRGSLRGMYNLRFVECRTGVQAIDRLAAGGIDLVMLDYALPDLDGLEVLSRLKQRGLTVPVVLLTSSNERELLLEAMRRGASDFLGKDEVNRARLVQVVRTSLERAQLHADLMRGQKLAAIGTLAGGIAHEFNNILQIVLGHSQFALTRDEPERLKKALKFCHDAADKGAGIVRQLLAFARRENTTSQLRFSLDRAVQEAVQVEAEAARRDGVDLRVHIRSKPKTLGDCNQIVQVLVNLLTNARHACTAMVTTRAQLHPRIDVLLETVDGYGCISVRDNGTGISPEDMQRLFEPFFTTKGSLGGRVYDGKTGGTGLGLAISATIIDAHNGRIDVSSTPGEGSTFTIVLPISRHEEFRTPPPATRGVSGSAPLDKGAFGKRVLIVDDEEMIAELLATYLQDKGLVCDVAASASEARALLALHDYDQFLLDLTLPGGVGGLELLQEIRARGGPSAAAAALAMTGHGPGAADEALFNAGFRGIVRKPFEVRELGRLISESLRIADITG